MRRLAVLLLVAVALVPTAAGATTVTVHDDAEYRQALTDLSADGSGPHTIVLGADISLHLADGQPVYDGTQPLTLLGNGHTIRGETNLQLLASHSSARLVVDDVTFRSASSGIESGGPVRVRNSRFVDLRFRTVHGVGGASAIYVYVSHTPLVVTNSTFLRNSTRGDGAAISAAGPVTVDRSTFRRNESRNSTISSVDDIDISGSTFTDNRARVAGVVSGYIGTRLSVRNSTFTGNRDSGFVNAAVLFAPHVEIDHVTIVDNDLAAAIRTDDLRSRNSVIAHGPRACRGMDEPVDAVGSVATDRSCRFPTLIADPGLGPIGDHGGPTATRVPGRRSPLVDAATCLPGIPRDQRGVVRPRGPRCDVGAVEAR